MRKAYGSTGVSYGMPWMRFVDKYLTGKLSLAVGHDGKGGVLSAPLPSGVSYESLQRIYEDADCICYHGGVEMVIPSHLA